MLRNLKTGARLFIAFGIVVGLTVALGLFSLRQMTAVSSLTERMYRHPLTVSTLVLEIEGDLVAMHRWMKDVALATNEKQIQVALARVNSTDAEVTQDFDLLRDDYLGNQADIDELQDAFIAWRPIRAHVVALMRRGEREKAAEITKGEGAEHMALLERKVATLADFAQAKAAEFRLEAERTHQRLISVLIALLVATSLVGAAVALAVTRSVTAPLRQLSKAARAVADGDISVRCGLDRRDEIGSLSDTFDAMAESIERSMSRLKERSKELQETANDLRGLRTTHAQLEEKAAVALRQFEQVVSSSTDMIVLLDKDLVCVAANEAYAAAFGKSRADVLGLSARELFGARFFGAIIEPRAKRCLAGELVDYQGWFDFPLAKQLYIEINYFPYRDTEGEIQGIVANGRDITARYQLEQELRRSQATSAATAELSQTYLATASLSDYAQPVVDSAADLTDAPLALFTTVDGDEARIVAVTAEMWRIVADNEFWRGAKATVDDGGYPVRLPDSVLLAAARTSRTVLKNDCTSGNATPGYPEGHPTIESYLSAPAIVGNEVVGMLAVANREGGFGDDQRAIVESLAASAALVVKASRSEQTLKKSEEKHRILFESSRDALMTLAPPSWTFSSANPAALRMFGARDEDEFLGRPPWEFSPEFQPDGRRSIDKAKELIETSMQKGSHFFEWEHRRLSGEVFPATVSVTSVEIAGEHVLQATIQDITERKQAEEEKAKLEDQYRHSHKMEAIGKLAGGVAHDFNNLLTVINTYAGFASDGLQEGDPLRADMQHILDAGGRAAGLTRQLLAFSRKQVIQPTVVDLNEVIADLEKMLQRVLGEDIELSTALEQNLGRVVVDRGQIDQVLMNLAVNARDAMPDGGKLTIESANVDLGSDQK